MFLVTTPSPQDAGFFTDIHMKINVKKLHPDAKLPVYATAGAACFDLYAHDVDGALTLGSNVHQGFPLVCGTGLAFEIPPGWVMLIFSRSGHGFNHEVRLANCVGVLDSDYRGEARVKLTSDDFSEDEKRPPLFVKPGDRVAQAMLTPVERIGFSVVDSLSETERGEGGFGSTGVS